MRSNDRATTLLLIGMVTAVVLVLLVSMVLGWHLGDPHIANRGGALASALAAAGVLFQIAYEVRLEEARRQLEEAMPAADLSTQRPTELLADKLIEQKRQSSMADLTRRRLRVAACVVLCAMAGETFHGFGDLILCSAVSCAAPHGHP